MKKCGTWNKITITGPREVLLQLRDETFSVDPEAAPDESDKRMAFDLYKVAPKPESLKSGEAMSLYIGWHLDQGGEFTSCENNEIIWSDRVGSLIINLTEAMLDNKNSRFALVDTQELINADPDFYAKVLHHWCDTYWCVHHNTYLRYGGEVIPDPQGDETWILQCRFETESFLDEFFRDLVQDCPELEFLIVSCMPSHSKVMIGVTRSGKFIHQNANQLREVLATDFEYPVPSGFSVEQYGDRQNQFLATNIAQIIANKKFVNRFD